jgi:hypothetical protein
VKTATAVIRHVTRQIKRNTHPKIMPKNPAIPRPFTGLVLDALRVVLAGLDVFLRVVVLPRV